MCLIVEILMLLAGLYALIVGKIRLTKQSRLEGWRARITGLLLIAPVAVLFFAGLLSSLIGIDRYPIESLLRFLGVAQSTGRMTFALLEGLVVLGGFGAALIFAFLTEPAMIALSKPEELPQRDKADDRVTPKEDKPSALADQSRWQWEQQQRLEVWLQFPRRIVLLLIAFGMVSALMVALRKPLLGTANNLMSPGQGSDWSISWATNMAVADVVRQNRPSTLLLLGGALIMALLLALVATLVAVLVHRLEEKTGPLGSVLKGLGRLWIFSNVGMPAFGIAGFLAIIFIFWLRLLPWGGCSPDEPGRLTGCIRHLILPTLTLALLPAALTAQAVTREVTLPREQAGARTWLTGLFKGLGVLLGQIGGLLSAMVLVELVLGWPGMGRQALLAAMTQDYPVLLGVLGVYAVLILVGRLASELFRWLERLVRPPILSPQPRQVRWRRTARKTWVVLALTLLLLPMGLAVAGLTVDPDEMLQEDLRGRLYPPSANHPWGTDALGRDLQARVLRGALITFGTIFLAAVVILLPGGLGGTVTGLLASRRTLWAESVADLLLLPADILLFIPPVFGAIVVALLLGWTANSPPVAWVWVALACAGVLLPRAVRAFQAYWLGRPAQHKELTLGLVGLGSLLLGTLFAGLWLVPTLEFLGFGVQPPIPSLGNVMRDATDYMKVAPHMWFVGGIVLWACALAYLTAADAVVGFSDTKEVLARLNE